MMLVMVIILIVGGLATQLIFEHMHSNTKVNAAADLVHARWIDCRTRAIEEGRPYRFAVIPNSGKFKIEPYQPTPQTGTTFNNDIGPANGGNGNNGFVDETTLPTGVRFGTKDSPVNADVNEPDGGEYLTIAVFNPDGTAQDDVEINFGAKGTQPLTLRLRALTGAVVTIRPEQRDNK
jgi:hypothetical protein